MEEVTGEFREPETAIELVPKKRAAGRGKKTQIVAFHTEEGHIDVSGSQPLHSKFCVGVRNETENDVKTKKCDDRLFQDGNGVAVATSAKKKSRKKKQTNRQMLEDLFDFTSGGGAAGGGAETTDDEAYNGRGVTAPAASKRRVRGGSAAATSTACHLSKKERAEIERKFSKPKNESQKKYIALLNDPTKKIVIATGPAGTGKTLLAVEYAVRNFIFGEYDKIIFTRPSVSVDEDLGYLPGTLEEKMAPWMRPLYDILYDHFTVRETTAKIEEKVIEICPLGFMRGRTFKNCCIICDEMQNSTPAQMKMLLTRIGSGSRLIITGDLDQCDRIERGGYGGGRSGLYGKNEFYSENGSREELYNGLEDFLRRFREKKSNSIVSVEFQKEDIEREEVVKEILDIYGN